MARAAAAFEVGLRSAAEGEDNALVAAGSARAHIETALTSVGAIEAENDGMNMAAQTELNAAITALVQSSAEAEDGEDVEQAGADFESMLHGQGSLLFNIGYRGRPCSWPDQRRFSRCGAERLRPV